MGLAAVGHYRLVGSITAGDVFFASDRLGKQWTRLNRIFAPKPAVDAISSPFNILQP
jgi:hypothetical protein